MNEKEEFIAFIPVMYLHGILLFDNVIKAGTADEIKACYKDLMKPFFGRIFNEANSAGLSDHEIVQKLMSL